MLVWNADIRQYVEDGLDADGNPDYSKQSLPQASGNGRLIDPKYATDAEWGNLNVDGGDAYKWRSPSGAKGQMVMTANGPMFQLPEDANTNYVTRDTNQSALGNFISELGQMGAGAAGMYGAVSGLGNLFGNGLASLSGTTTPSVTSSVTNGVPFTPEQQVGGWSTSATGDNIGEWDWLDNALQGDNNGIDFTPGAAGGDAVNGWDFPVDTTAGGTTIPASSIGADFGDVAMPPGTTAPSGVFGSNAYGDPMTVIKQIAQGTLPLSSLFGAGGTSNQQGTSAFGTGQPNYGNALAALFGYMGNQDMANKLLEATKYATDKADPFASQRPYYQSALKNMYDNPSQVMNNSVFSGIRDQAMNATQRALSAKGYGGSGNEALGMMQAGTQAQTQFAMPYLQQLATNAGAGFGPGQAGSIYQQGQTQAAQAQNNAYGNIGYGINQAIGNRSPLEDLFGRITSNGGQGNTGGGSGINIRIA